LVSTSKFHTFLEMKLLTLALFFSLMTQTFAQTPDYFANDPKWGGSLWNSNQWDPPYIATSDIYVYYLNGEEDINGNTYHKVFKKGEIYDGSGSSPISTYDIQTSYYLRQDGKNIRFYTSQISMDSLLVSYDYAVGDTVKGDVFQGCGHSNDTIQKIDSILVNTEYRKVFYIDTINGPVITEGIGHQIDLLSSTGGLFEMICEGAGFSYYINCFGFGDISYWDPHGQGGNCALNIGIEEKTKLDFEVYPNPAKDIIQIKTPNSNALKVQLISISGEVIHKGNSDSIDISKYPSGIYIIQIQDLSSGLIGRQKLIIE
jgi:hypothetical protein